MQRLVELAGDIRLHGALVRCQLLLPGDLVVVARAAVAENAALAVERDVLRERAWLLEMESRPVDAAGRISVPEREVLQRALAALVADRAVERVVDQLELEDGGTCLHPPRRLRPHDHALRGPRRACGLRAGRAG